MLIYIYWKPLELYQFPFVFDIYSWPDLDKSLFQCLLDILPWQLQQILPTFLPQNPSPDLNQQIYQSFSHKRSQMNYILAIFVKYGAFWGISQSLTYQCWKMKLLISAGGGGTGLISRWNMQKSWDTYWPWDLGW